MPPKRPRAPSSPEPGAVTHTSRRIRPTSYDSLPAELKLNIVELACRSSSPHPAPLYDLTTCLHLSLVSKQFHAQVLPHLYRQISITRPSSLYALHQTLQSHPERGPLVKNLHIGSQTALPSDWWPLSQAYPEPGSLFARQPAGEGRSYTWLATSLPPEERPADFEAGWPLDAAKSGCRAAAIDDALQVVQDKLGVDLLREGKKRDEGEARHIGSILEVQAVLDLYLVKVKEVEDADPKLAKLARPGARVPAPCRNGKCSHYPTLVITQAASQPAAGSSRSLRNRPPHIPPGAFVLSRSMLLRHTSRRGAVADRFDHPHLIERSGFEVAVIPPPEIEYEGYRKGRGARYTVRSADWHYEGAHEADDSSELADLGEADDYELKRGEGEALNAPLINTATFGANLQVARFLLAHATAVQNLSLTGFLERAVGSRQQSLPSLRRLTIGPPPLAWSNKITLHGLEHIEELRIGGAIVISSEVDFILKCRGLKKLEWSMGEPFDPDDEPVLLSFVTRLLNKVEPSPSVSLLRGNAQVEEVHPAGSKAAVVDESKHSPSGSPHGSADEQKAHSQGGEDALPLIIARLDASDVDWVLNTTGSDEEENAWLNGLLLPGVPRRLHLVAKDLAFAAAAEAMPSEDNTSGFWPRLYREGSHWWYEGTV